jgi:hypothetical protein
MLQDGQATRDGVRDAFQKLRGRFQKRRESDMHAETRFFFFYAGHGVTRDEEDTACAYYNDRDDRASKPGLSGADLTEYVEQLDPTETMLFVDCCYAGEVPKPSKQTNTAWFCSSTHEAAWEPTQDEDPSGMCLSRYATQVVKGIEGDAPKKKDGLYANDLAEYLEKVLKPSESNNALRHQKPYFSITGTAPNFRVAVGINAKWVPEPADPDGTFGFDWRNGDYPEIPWCYVVVAEATTKEQENALKERVTNGLLFVTKSNDRKMHPKPLLQKVSEAISEDFFESTVTLLCAADVVVFDISDYEPAVMLLMGIRSVLRRGVNIAVVRTLLQGDALGDIPFIIKEINFVPFMPEVGQRARDPRHPQKLFNGILTEGFRQHREVLDYLDLPVYDAVRHPPLPSPLVSENQKVFVLCSFQGYHDNFHFPYLERNLLQLMGEENTRIFRTLELQTPRLVSQTLFEAIRDTPFCLVDWTGFPANVFFEMGVRLGASRIGPVCIMDTETEAFLDGKTEPGPTNLDAVRTSALSQARRQCRSLLALFDPVPYNPRSPEGAPALQPILDRYDKCRQQAEEPELSGPYATYSRIVCELDIEKERYSKAIHTELEQEAFNLLGDPELNLNPFALFSEVPGLEQLIRSAAVEKLLAAWYYLENRYSELERMEEKSLCNSYITIGNKLSTLLRRSDKSRAKQIFSAVKTFDQKLRKRDER